MGQRHPSTKEHLREPRLVLCGSHVVPAGSFFVSVHRAGGVCGGNAGTYMLGVALLHLVQSPLLSGL